MSQITYVVQYKGEARKNYGHYAELMLSSNKRIEEEGKFAQASGVVQDRIEAGLADVTESNKEKFFNTLAPKDLPRLGKDAFMSDTGENPMVYVDFDHNILYVDESKNDFAHFQNYLPEGWVYKQMPSATMTGRYKNLKAQRALSLKMQEKLAKGDFKMFGDIPMHEVPSQNPKGWHNEPINHALASKGIKVGKSRTKR